LLNITKVIISKRVRWAQYIRSTRGRGEKVCNNLQVVGNPDGKRPFERPRHRMEDNTKMYLTLLRWGYWLDLPDKV
jgi:hypothetical protein